MIQLNDPPLPTRLKDQLGEVLVLCFSAFPWLTPSYSSAKPGSTQGKAELRSTAPLTAQVCLSRSEDPNPEICSPNSSCTSTEAGEAGERSGTERDGCLVITFEVGGRGERWSLCAGPGGLKDETALLWPAGIVTGSSQTSPGLGITQHSLKGKLS